MVGWLMARRSSQSCLRWISRSTSERETSNVVALVGSRSQRIFRVKPLRTSDWELKASILNCFSPCSDAAKDGALHSFHFLLVSSFSLFFYSFKIYSRAPFVLTLFLFYFVLIIAFHSFNYFSVSNSIAAKKILTRSIHM